jgi:hypothetical protein
MKQPCKCGCTRSKTVYEYIGYLPTTYGGLSLQKVSTVCKGCGEILEVRIDNYTVLNPFILAASYAY